ncbi:hypothetical protein FRC00_006653 [Tulasnella sp. 408]|nr:hypothetical protein FRC00_006653 [Tulasnella sp. 408]
MLLWKLRSATRLRRKKTPSKIACLPYEILLMIIELLDERSVACLLRTCRVFRDIVEPILYRHIRVYRGPKREEWLLNPLKAQLLHRTLVGRPDLLPGILSYHGPLIPAWNALGNYPTHLETYKRSRALDRKLRATSRARWGFAVSDEYLEKAKIIFSGTTNIQDLHFTEPFPDSMAHVLGVTDAPQLNMMNIQRLAVEPGLSSPALGPILRTHPRLKHLELDPRQTDLPWEEVDLPELESLKANLSQAAKIVPGRPIKKLELLGNWSDSRIFELLAELTLSTCGIRELTTKIRHPWWYDDCVVWPEDLRALARHLPTIERLCLCIALRISDSVLVEALPAFGSLSHLKLLGEVSKEYFYSPFDDETQRGYSPANFGRLVRGLKEHCPSLVEVEWSPTARYTCCDWETEDLFTYRATQ